jgi:uncharacterized protein (TIGR03083 family)
MNDGRRPISSRSGELLDQGPGFFTGIITRLGEVDWERPTPCPGWTARDLLGHLATSMRVAISVMQGREPTWPDVARPCDLVDGDPAGFWRGIVVKVQDVLRTAEEARIMTTPPGGTIADDLAIRVIDLYVHSPAN